MRFRVPLVVLGGLIALAVIQLASCLPEMPERIATHFGAGGRPNGWMTTIGFVVFELVVVGFMSTTMVGSALLARALPARFINVPNRDYWVAPERQREASDRLLGHMLWLVCWVVALFIGINHLVFVANRAEGGTRLPEQAFLWLLGFALAALVVWTVTLFTLFRRPR